MAGQEHLIAVGEREHPWSLLVEVARATPADAWVLVGGLMVHVHALRAGIVASRPTRDIDLVLDVQATTVSAVAGPLQTLGFRPEDTTSLHRFSRGDDIVDVMVGKGERARWLQRPVFHAPAARQAADRRDWYVLQVANGDVRIGVPDPLGAIVVKAAAYRNDQRDRPRHLEDLAVLLAAAGGRRGLGLDRLTPNDKTHLRAVTTHLGDAGHIAWSVLEDADSQIGQRALAAVAAQVS